MNKPKAFSIVHNLLIDVEFVEILDVVVISERFFSVFYLAINSSFVPFLALLSRFFSRPNLSFTFSPSSLFHSPAPLSRSSSRCQNP